MKKLIFENNDGEVLVNKISETDKKYCDVCREKNKKLFEFKTFENIYDIPDSYLTPIKWKIIDVNRHICFDCVKQLFKEIDTEL